jgi:hypothetical protein
MMSSSGSFGFHRRNASFVKIELNLCGLRFPGACADKLICVGKFPGTACIVQHHDCEVKSFYLPFGYFQIQFHRTLLASYLQRLSIVFDITFVGSKGE